MCVNLRKYIVKRYVHHQTAPVTPNRKKKRLRCFISLHSARKSAVYGFKFSMELWYMKISLYYVYKGRRGLL